MKNTRRSLLVTSGMPVPDPQIGCATLRVTRIA